MIGDAIASMLSYIKRYDARRGEKPGFFVDLVEKANIFQRNPVSLALVAIDQLRRRQLELYSIAIRSRWNLSSSYSHDFTITPDSN